jgi:hypothetical protein
MTNKVKRDEKRKAARLRNKARHEIIEKQELELEDESEILDEEVEEPVQKELVQKDYGMGEMAMPMTGPTTWAEYDALQAAMEEADHVREVSYTVRDLVSNILYSDMTPDEKSNAIKAVGDGFGKKVAEMDAEDAAPMTKELDLDLLELQALISKDKRHMETTEKVSDWISKAVLTSAAENKLSDSAFALVTTKDGKKVRKYPIHDKAHVRAALSYAAKEMNSGGPGAADAKAALPKIHAAAKKMGIGAMKKENGIVIEKDASGSWRWIGWPTNKFKDSSGDIITEKAHMDYVEWVNKDIQNNAPVFTSCHAPGTARTNPVDFAAYENGFVVMSGKLTDTEAGMLLKASAKCDIGMSHTAWGQRSGENPNQVDWYRAFEVSDMPVETADNPFTYMELSKEVDMNQLEYLTELLGSKEKAEQALQLKTSMKQKELNEAGVESKEKSTEAAPVTPVAKEVVVVNNASPDVEKIAAQVFERISKELGVNELNEYLTQLKTDSEKVPVLEALVKELVKDNSDKLAEMIEPPAGKFIWMNKARASQSKETALNESKEADKLLKEAKPELGWLSQVTGTTPVKS